MRKATILDVVRDLTPDDFEFTVEVNSVRHDIYSFVSPGNGKVGSMALSIQKGKAVISVIREGILTEEEAIKAIEESLEEGQLN